jgi:hypothetical protein
MVLVLRSLKRATASWGAALVVGLPVVPSALALSDALPVSTATPMPGLPVAAPSPKGLLDRLLKAERAFDVGDFLAAEQVSKICVEQRESLAAADRDRLYLLQARLAFAFKRPEDVERWLRDLHRNNPKAQLSTLVDPPQMFAIWKKIGDEDLAKPSAAAVTQSEPQATGVQSGAASASPAPIATGTTSSSRPSAPSASDGAAQPRPGVWNRAVNTYVTAEPGMKRGVRPALALLPFGVGHFTYGKVWQGATFMVGETAFVLLVSGLADSTEGRLNATFGSTSIGGVSETETEERDGDSARFTDQASAYKAFGVTGFAALWGIEIYNLLPDIAKDSPTTAKWTRFGLSFAPFGVAQLKNKEPVKAIGLAGSQALFLLLSGALPHENQRGLAQVMFFGSVVFGMVDGWLNHDWSVPTADPMKWSFAVAPMVPERGRPVGLQLGVSRQN